MRRSETNHRAAWRSFYVREVHTRVHQKVDAHLFQTREDSRIKSAQKSQEQSQFVDLPIQAKKPREHTGVSEQFTAGKTPVRSLAQHPHALSLSSAMLQRASFRPSAPQRGSSRPAAATEMRRIRTNSRPALHATAPFLLPMERGRLPSLAELSRSGHTDAHLARLQHDILER